MKLPPVPEATPECKLTIMNAGFSTTKRSHLIKGADSSDISIPALFFLIEHPVHGNILFDTGYSTRYYEAIKKFPFSLMNKILPVQITEKENAIHQLLDMNIKSKDIQTVILSHLHADHVGGIADFSDSTIYVDKKEWKFGKQSKLKLLMNGYLKQLYENINRSALKQLIFENSGYSYGPFSNAIDLFKDGTILLVPLPGHSIGQFGLLLNITNEKRYFFIADSVYLKANYQKIRGGSILSRFAHYNLKQYESNFPMLRKLETMNPHLIIIPSHDPNMYKRYVSDKKER